MSFAHASFTEHEQMLYYFYQCDDDISTEEMVDFLLEVKRELSYKGLDIPSLSLIFMMVKESFFDREIKTLDHNWKPFLDLLDQRESIIFRVSINDFQKYDWQSTFSGCQFVGAGLCYFIPDPKAALIAEILIHRGLINLQEEPVLMKKVQSNSRNILIFN